jgi:general secretion pathway protein C
MFTLFNILQQYQKAIGLALIAGLVILMSFSIAQSISFFLDDALITTSIKQAPFSNQVKPGRNTQQLSQLDLFGLVAKTASPMAQDAPETRLNLELQGIFISENPAHSSAIIAEKNKSGKLFRVGDKLPGNAYLHAVRPDHILLRRGSRLEKLMFLLAKVTFDSGNTTTQADIHLTTSNTQSSKNVTSASDLPSANLPAEDSSLRAYLEQNKRRLQSNPTELLNELGMSAVSQDSANGYKIDQGNAGAALTQAGLQTGDVVISVNGVAVGVAMNDSRLVDQAMAAGRVRVEVQRAGRRFFLTIPIP